jgi:hypothetical protein
MRSPGVMVREEFGKALEAIEEPFRGKFRQPGEQEKELSELDSTLFVGLLGLQHLKEENEMSETSGQRDSNLESDVDDLLQFDDHRSDCRIGLRREKLGRSVDVVTVVVRERCHQALSRSFRHLVLVGYRSERRSGVV